MDKLPEKPSGDARTLSGPPLSKWTLESESVVASCRVFDLVSRRCRHPSRGCEDEFFALRALDWVNVLPVTPDKRIVLVRQYRFGIQEFCWEIPGGVMDPGEDPLAAGLRELREETGYAPRRARLLAQVRPNPAILDNTCYFALAEDVEPAGELAWDEHEELEVGLFPVDEVYAMARSGEISHSLVVAALFHYYPEWLLYKARRRPEGA